MYGVVVTYTSFDPVCSRREVKFCRRSPYCCSAADELSRLCRPVRKKRTQQLGTVAASGVRTAPHKQTSLRLIGCAIAGSTETTLVAGSKVSTEGPWRYMSPLPSHSPLYTYVPKLKLMRSHFAGWYMLVRRNSSWQFTPAQPTRAPLTIQRRKQMPALQR